jgi:phospholipid/cholesterol/gamma-HCH transport system substrate-binding protein
MALRNVRRRRRDTEPWMRTLLKGAAVTALLLAGGWIAVSAYNGVPGRRYSTLYVDVPQAGNLLQHDPVRIAGVRVGQVQAKAITPGGDVRLKLQIEPGVSLPAGTKVALRASGLLGARYVQLLPGHDARSLASGMTIRAPRKALTYGVPEALDTFDAQTRGALGATVRELGKGMVGNGIALNDALRVSSEQIVRFQQLAAAIDRGAAQRLLPSLDSGMGALDAHRQELGELFGPAADALAPFTQERTAVRAVLTQAPPALAAATAGLADGRRLLGAVRALATQARRTLPSAPAGLERASGLLRASRVPLARTANLLRAAGPAVPAALRITGGASPVLSPLQRAVDDATPMLRRVAPYGCDIANFAAVFRSMTGLGGTGDGPNGPAMSFRLTAIPSSPDEAAGAADRSGVVVRDGYPAPCRYLDSAYPAVKP